VQSIVVLEKNPPKQGLKLVGWSTRPPVAKGFREKSTKTRIETTRRKEKGRKRNSFREKSTKTRIETRVALQGQPPFPEVLEKNPPKQGLKQQKLNLPSRREAMF